MNKISQTVPYQFDTVFSPFKADEFLKALQFLSAAGFTGVEVAIARPQDVNIDQLNKEVGDAGLAVTTISTGQAYGLYGIFLASFDTEKQQQAISFLKGHVDVSAEIGKPSVTVGLLRGKMEPEDKNKLLENFRRALDPCVEHAAKKGVCLQVEPITKAETTMINSTYECLEFLHSIGDPAHVGVLYDTYHSNLEDGGMVKAIEAAAGRIMNVHFADSHRGLPGYGEIDFKGVYQAIQATGYTGPYALETLAIPSPEFINEHCYESISAIIDEK